MNYQNQRNPILPLDIHIPDGEGHVMSDGRLYIYGSFDAFEDDYCSDYYRVASTGDLKNWVIHEVSLSGTDIPWFGDPDAPKYPLPDWSKSPYIGPKMAKEAEERKQHENDPPAPPKPRRALLYAPDCAEKNGRYYLYFCMADESEGMAVSDKPEGPFKDPVRMPCGEIDPAVFIDDDGRAYYYWGQMNAHGVELNADMCSFKEGTRVDDIVTEREHFFHEGSSMRKINGRYYYIYADIEREKPTALGYSVGDSPLGPFTYGGIIIDNLGCDPETWNDHGSLVEMNGQWYVTYHRSSRNGILHRRLCMEKVEILPDGTIPEVVMTSQGVGDPFAPGETIFGYQACFLEGKLYIDLNHDPLTREAIPECLTGIQSGDRASFRYVKSEDGWRSARILSRGKGKVRILLDNNEVGAFDLADGENAFPIAGEKGEHTLTLALEKPEDLKILSVTLI